MRKEDEGHYECQIGISTAQPVGRMIYLKVIGELLNSYFVFHSTLAHWKKNWLLITLFLFSFRFFAFSLVLILTRTDPQLSILQGEEIFAEAGSNLNLTCYAKQVGSDEDEKRFQLKWTYNNQVSLYNFWREKCSCVSILKDQCVGERKALDVDFCSIMYAITWVCYFLLWMKNQQMLKEMCKLSVTLRR